MSPAPSTSSASAAKAAKGDKPKITRNRKYLACDACRSWRRKCQRINDSEICAGCSERKIKCETTYIRKPRTTEKSSSKRVDTAR
ncbi:hypothetical protein BT69DRAFT_1121853 [Atractiella rhizophila]|nr:hypothetical protein BT69DRAFT_1121853 [Atractiella rhizophila]